MRAILSHVHPRLNTVRANIEKVRPLTKQLGLATMSTLQYKIAPLTQVGSITHSASDNHYLVSPLLSNTRSLTLDSFLSSFLSRFLQAQMETREKLRGTAKEIVDAAPPPRLRQFRVTMSELTRLVEESRVKKKKKKTKAVKAK
jgi:hypothetical protein